MKYTERVARVVLAELRAKYWSNSWRK